MPVYQDVVDPLLIVWHQARKQGGRRGRNSPRKFSPPLEKCAGHRLRLLDIVQKIWAPPRKLFAPPGVPRWLQACLTHRCRSHQILGDAIDFCPNFPNLAEKVAVQLLPPVFAVWPPKNGLHLFFYKSWAPFFEVKQR